MIAPLTAKPRPSERRYTIDITAAEAARRLGVTRQAATVWAREGRFPGAWLDDYTGAWHIDENEVETLRIEREVTRDKNDDAA